MPTLQTLLHGRPLLLETRSSTWFITLTVCTAIFTDIFLYAVVVPVFPFSLQSRMGVAQENVQHWLSILLAVYSAALLIGSPICGYLADRVQYRKWPLLGGLITVLGATVLLMLAPNLPLLILGRVLQGLSASVIWVVGLALLADTVEQENIAMALGYVGTATGLGTLVAPLLGGIVYQRSGYYAVFAMTFGVILLDIIMRLALIEKKAARKWLVEDSDSRQVQNDGAVEGNTDPEKRSPETTTQNSPPINDQNGSKSPASTTPKSDPEKSGARQDGSTVPQRPKSRLPPIISLWASGRLLAAFWGVTVVASIMTGLDTVLTLFVNRTFGWNSQAAGILFLAPLLPLFFAPYIGGYIDKHGGRWIGGLGLLSAIPFFVLLRLVTHNSIGQKVLLAALLLLGGIGLAMSMTALIAEFSKVCDAKEKARPGVFGKRSAYAQSYSIFNISWATGSLIGAFWSGGIYSAADWSTVAWSWALLCASSAVPVLLFTDGWIGDRKR